MKKYIVQALKGKGEKIKDMYYEIQVFSDLEQLNNISEAFFNNLIKKYKYIIDKSINKGTLIFDKQINSIKLQYGNGTFFDLLSILYENDSENDKFDNTEDFYYQ